MVMSLKGYVGNIERETIKNTDFRRVIYTGKHSQLVLMSLRPGEEITALPSLTECSTPSIITFPSPFSNRKN
jgi:hypothetical protein